MFYFVLFLIVVCFLILNQSFWNRKIDKVLSILFCLLLIILGTIRWHTGYDWGAYQGYYIYIRDYVTSLSDFKVSFEPIFASFYFIAKYTGLGFIVVQFIQIFLIISLKYALFKKYTPYVFLALFLNFCFFPDIVTVRNFLAGTIVLYSLKFVESKRVLPFVLTILIATNIHFSSLLSLLFYPIYHKSFSIPLKSVTILLCVVLGLAGFFELLLKPIADLTGSAENSKIAYYFENSEEGNIASKDLVTTILGLLRRLIILPIILFFEYKFFKADKFYRGLSNLFIFGNCLYFIIGNGSLSIFQRLSIPFYLCEVLLLVLIYYRFQHKIKPLFLIFLVFYGFTKYYFIYQTTKTIKPYITIFDYQEVESEYWNKGQLRKPFYD